MIRAIFVYVFVAAYILLLSPVGLTWTWLSKDTRFIYRLARFCVRAAGWVCRIRIRVRGKDKIVPGETYVFVCNHQGNFDGPVLFYALPRDIRIIVKKELTRVPVFSLVMKQVQCVPVDRSDPYSSRASIDCAATLLQKGLTFLSFPEGTRSRDGRLGEFKKGAFVMAIKAQVPVIPVTILNTRTIQRPGEFAVRPATVELVIHDPIPTKGMTLQDRDRLTQKARAAVASGFPASGPAAA